MASARKRPKAEQDEGWAECPFKVAHPTPGDKDKKQKKRSRLVNGIKYYSESFIFVANSSAIQRQKNPDKRYNRGSDRTMIGLPGFSRSVPAMSITYMPEFTGLDVINLVSVTALATVNQWDEQNEEEIQSALYWRQAIDVRTMELLSVEPRCRCNKPENPDKTLIGCNSDGCSSWLHDDCLLREALMATYQRLGTDKSHRSKPVKEEDVDGEGSKRPLSLSESGAAQTTQHPIDVKPEDQKTIKLADVENNAEHMNVGRKDNTTIPVASSSTDDEPKKRGHPRKSDAGELSVSKPYEGLFEGVIRNDLSPPVVDITNLRQDVFGGAKS
ncbi:hypothetical protein PG985_005549 [Apiospora marii]|uniref:uncharacterized protein n=1 Tax=Apiospora marii TaxID=335849 RepID=UPI00313067C1